MAKALVYRIARRYGIAPEVIEAQLLPLLGPERVLQGGDEIIRDGSSISHCILVVEGFAAQYKLMASGRRQITGIVVSGDIANIGSLFLEKADQGVAALGPAVVRSIPQEQLRTLIDTAGDIRRAIFQQVVEDLLLHRERIVSMGRRTAVEHFATLICELHWRLLSVDKANPSGFFLPLTQTDLADAMGLSTVHVNRVVKQLRAAGVLRITGHHVIIKDKDRLSEIAGFRNHSLSTLFEDRGLHP